MDLQIYPFYKLNAFFGLNRQSNIMTLYNRAQIISNKFSANHFIHLKEIEIFLPHL